MKTNNLMIAAILMITVNVSIFASEITTKGNNLENTSVVKIFEEAAETTMELEEWMTSTTFTTGAAEIEMEKWMFNINNFAAEFETTETDIAIETWMIKPMVVKNQLPVEEEKEPALEEWMYNF